MNVWIDTDPAIGIPGCDVDDGLALIQAFHSPELVVRGVSAVFGNAPLDRTLPLAREICREFGPHGLDALAGAASSDDLGRETEAVRGLARALEEGPLSILALGPVTNVATLLQRRPDLAARIDSIVAVAARRPGLEFFSVASQKQPFPDFNFECDPAAMQLLLDGGRPLAFAPWEVSSHVFLTASDLDALASTGAPGAYVSARSRAWLSTWTDELGAPGFNPFDTLAVAWLTHPEGIEHLTGPAWIEDGDPPRLCVGGDADRAPGRPEVVYCHRPEPAFKELLLARLAAPARR